MTKLPKTLPERDQLDKPDPTDVANHHNDEVRYFAEKYGLSYDLVKYTLELVVRTANERDAA